MTEHPTTTTPRATTASAGATLPLTLNLRRAERVHLVDGRTGWPARAAEILQGDAKAIVLVADPALEESFILDGFTPRIVLDVPWAHSLTLEAATQAFREGGHRYLEALVTVAKDQDLASRVHAAEVVLDRLAGPASFELIGEDEGWAAATGRTKDDIELRVSATRSAGLAPSLRVRALGEHSVVDMHLPDERTARPASLLLQDGAGVRITRSRWETPSRTAWRRAVDLFEGSPPEEAADLSRFRRVLRRMS